MQDLKVMPCLYLAKNKVLIKRIADLICTTGVAEGKVVLLCRVRKNSFCLAEIGYSWGRETSRFFPEFHKEA